MVTALLVFAFTFISGFTQILTGFGFAIVIMALLPLVIPYEIVIFLSLLGGSTLGIWMVVRYRRKIQWKLALLPLAFSLLGTLLGIFFNTKLTGSLYMRLLGLFLIAMALWLQIFSKKVRIPGTPLAGACVGIAVGVFNALFTMGGPPLVLYLTAAIDDKEAYVSTRNLVLTASAILTAICRAAILGVPPELALHVIPWALALVVSAFFGSWAFSKINAGQLKQIIFIFMFIIGTYFLITG